MKKVLLAAGALALLVALGTYVAGEQTEVVVLRTFDPAGAVHETKMWAVDRDGTVWVRVANRGRGGWVDGWYDVLLRHDPVPVKLVRAEGA
jgi:hypothetical protein